jgi:hypothetical protein
MLSLKQANKAVQLQQRMDTNHANIFARALPHDNTPLDVEAIRQFEECAAAHELPDALGIFARGDFTEKHMGRAGRAMSRQLNLIGCRFGRLTVVRDTGLRRSRNVVWAVACDCGKQIFTTSHYLKSGYTNSCGCIRLQLLAAIPQKGESNPQAKLTEDDVLSIRASYRTADWTQRELASLHNVQQACISKIVRGQRWSHLTH